MGRFGRWVGFVALVPLGGCFWGQEGYSAGRASYNPLEQTLTTATVDDVTELWSAATRTSRSPLAWGDRVVVVAGDRVVGLDAATGATAWSRPAPPQPAMAIRHGVLYLANDGCTGPTLLALDIVTGDRRADQDVTAGGPCGEVDEIFGAGDRHVFLREWEVRDNGPGVPPAITPWHKVVDWDTGATHLVQAGDVIPVLDEPNGQYYWVIQSAQADTLHAWSLTGQANWSHTVSVVPHAARLMADGNRVYLTDRYAFADDGGFQVFDAATGAELWRGHAAGETKVAAVRDGTVYTGITADPDGRLLAYEDCGADVCAPAWVGTGDGWVDGVVAAADLVYAHRTGDGGASVDVYAAAGCGAATCPPLRSFPVTSNGVALPNLVVSGGRLIVATATGITAYGLAG